MDTKRDAVVTDSKAVEGFLGRIETAAGAMPDREGGNAVLIAEILKAVHGLRSLLGAVRAH
jgi:hypothetical protein